LVNVTSPTVSEVVAFSVNGQAVEVPIAAGSLLEVLRDRLGLVGAKDGCSPQGQCGCCTVWIDGEARVSCVTGLGRLAGRSVTTIEGLPDAPLWAECFTATGASQCGFCTPGIVMRLASRCGHDAAALGDRSRVDGALSAHLCRCTGWQSIHEACALVANASAANAVDASRSQRGPRDLGAAARRAELEGGVAQRVGSEVPLGSGGFSEDIAPRHALVAMRDDRGEWHVAETVTEARQLASKVSGRKTTAPLRWPLELPDGEWERTLCTTWIEPAYLELDAAWCLPGGEPSSPLANGGAFGGKSTTEVAAAARMLADRHGRAVRALYTREDVVRWGPKRPPIAAGVRPDGTGVLRVVRTEGLDALVASVAPGLRIEHVDVSGPPTSAWLRGSGWVEAAVLLSSLQAADVVRAPSGGWASATVDERGVHVGVHCGMVLDDVVLRSFCIGAAHQALGWVRSEGIVVDEDGVVHDLTLRSLGILRAADMPHVEVEIDHRDASEPVNGSDAVFAAVAAAAWRGLGYPARWPACRR
jgi:xanthine dehydrogenase small subunit